MSNETSFPDSVDPALIQDSNYRFTPGDRQYVDNQIRALQAWALENGGGSGGVFEPLDVLVTDLSSSVSSPYQVIGSQTEAVEELIGVNTTTEPKTIYLPGPPSNLINVGHRVTIFDSAGHADTNPITIEDAPLSGSTIGPGMSYVINRAWGTVSLVYAASGAGWVIVGTSAIPSGGAEIPSGIDWKTGSVNTTDSATQTTVCSSGVIPDGANVAVEVVLNGRAADGSVAAYSAWTSAKRVSGTLTIVGTLTPTLTFAQGSDTALNTCTATVDSSGNRIRLRVNGIDATTITWFGSMRLYIN